VQTNMDEQVHGLAFAGTGGVVAVGGQIAVVNDTSKQNAHVDDSATLPQAGGGIFVTTQANRDVSARAFGGGIGLVAIGAGVATTSVNGDALATIGNVAVGGSGPVGGITVTAND